MPHFCRPSLKQPLPSLHHTCGMPRCRRVQDLTFPRIWLNFFSPTTVRSATTAGVKGPTAETLAMLKPVIPAADLRLAPLTSISAEGCETPEKAADLGDMAAAERPERAMGGALKAADAAEAEVSARRATAAKRAGAARRVEDPNIVVRELTKPVGMGGSVPVMCWSVVCRTW